MPDGRWIAATAWEVRDIFQRLTAQCFGRLVKARIDRLPPSTRAAFSPRRTARRGWVVGGGGRTSPGAREVLCRLGVVQSFGRAAEDAARIGNVPVSKEELRLPVESEAAAVARGRNAGTIPAARTSADTTVQANGGTVVTRVYAAGSTG